MAQPIEPAFDPQRCTSLRAAESEVLTWLLAGIYDLLLVAGSFRRRAECRLLQAFWVWSPALGPDLVTCRLDELSPSLLALSYFVSKTRSSVRSSGPQHKKSRTPDLWSDLVSVQRDVNQKFKPTRETRFAWDYSVDGTGNCVQFALEKRRALIRRGWPAGALQLATAVTPGDVGHLVLVIDTTEGDWVLDNLRADVVRWEGLHYRWIARQQGPSMGEWVSVAQRN
jgi:predicted transglutaminase-like cysteine proteinase